MKTINITDNATDFVGKLNDNFGEAQNHVPIKVGKNLCDPSGIIKGRVINSSGVITSSGASYSSSTHDLTGYIPIKAGQTLTCNVRAASDGRKYCALFAKKGDTTCISGTLTFGSTITNNLGYDAYAVFCYYRPNGANGVQVEIGSTSTLYEPYSPIGGYGVSSGSGGSGIDYASYGDIGRYYPHEIDDIVNILDIGTKLRFVHVSDNHYDGACQFAMDLADATAADFFVNTGDIVTDKFSDSYAQSLSKMLAMAKPAYITLGNHDCQGSASLQDRFEKFIQPLNEHNGMPSNTKTYYSVVKKGVRCIFLDMCDAIEGANLNMSYYTTGCKMTQEQIEWFIGELLSAATNNQAVACFIHILPGKYNNYNKEWSDVINPLVPEGANSNNAIGTLWFLPKIIHAFMYRLSVSFAHNNVDFTADFTKSSSNGRFAGWFCGHTHQDVVGTVRVYDENGNPTDYTRQHFTVIARPNSVDYYNGDYRYPTEDMANYVTIQFVNKGSDYYGWVTVYRVGSQTTRCAGERKCFMYRF